jgi:hypothetical protein
VGCCIEAQKASKSVPVTAIGSVDHFLKLFSSSSLKFSADPRDLYFGPFAELLHDQSYLIKESFLEFHNHNVYPHIYHCDPSVSAWILILVDVFWFSQSLSAYVIQCCNSTHISAGLYPYSCPKIANKTTSINNFCTVLFYL